MTSLVWGACVVCLMNLHRRAPWHSYIGATLGHRDFYLILGAIKNRVWMEFCIVPYSTTFVVVFLISDLDVRSLWSLCLGNGWLFVTGGLVYKVDIGSTLVRTITAFGRGGRSRHVLLGDSYLGVNCFILRHGAVAGAWRLVQTVALIAYCVGCWGVTWNVWTIEFWFDCQGDRGGRSLWFLKRSLVAK